MSKKNLVIVICIVVVLVGLAFYAGSKIKLSPGVKNTPDQMNGTSNFSGNRMNRTNGGNFSGGTVISKDSTTLTVQGKDGSSKIIFYTNETPIMKMVSGSIADISSGENISIVGTSNPDGSISASSIQIRNDNNLK